MTNKLAFALSFTASAALLATAAVAQNISEGGKKLSATLSGANEVPPADPDGSGTAKVTVNPGQSRLCYELTVRNIDAATAAHIHSAPVGINGPVVVPLAAPSDGDSSGCVDIARSLGDAIRKAPQGYYVNVHNATYPGGAIRGQLG